MSGGKGGSSSSQVEIPDWIAQPAQRNIARAESAQQIGYMPYMGPEVAAFSPTEEALMQSRANTAQMLGILPQGYDAMAGMPQAQEFAGGVRGYSSFPLYEQAAQEVARTAPGQAQAYQNLFVDPITGAPAQNFTQAQMNQARNAASSGQMQQAYYGNNGEHDNTGVGYQSYANTPSGLEFAAGEAYQNLQGNPFGVIASPGTAIIGGMANQGLQNQGYGYVTNPNAVGGGYYTRDRDSGGNDNTGGRDSGATDSMRGERDSDGWGE